MPRMQRKTPKASPGRKLPPVPAQSRAFAARTRAPAPNGDTPTRRETQAAAIDLILAGVPKVVRSVRVPIFGASQKGKTTFALKLAAAMAERGICGTLVIHDQKFPDHSQYLGSEVHSLDEAKQRFIEGAPAIICRAPITADEAAGLVREAAQNGERATLLIDEPRPALKVNSDGEPMDRVWAGPNLLWLCLEGGGLGASLIELCQMPQMMPGSLKNNATVLVYFGLGGGALEYAQGLSMISRDAAELVPKFPAGVCTVVPTDQDWSGRIFGPM